MSDNIGVEEAKRYLLWRMEVEGIAQNVRADVGQTWVFKSKRYSKGKARTYQPPGHPGMIHGSEIWEMRILFFLHQFNWAFNVLQHSLPQVGL